MKKQNVDWEKVEMEFRAGQVSIRAIAQEYRVSEGAIRKRAKRENWQRDLANRVLSRVHDKLERSTQQVRSPNAISEESIIESAASRTMGIIDIHRKAAVQQRETVERLLESVNKLMSEADMDTATLKELSIIARNFSGTLDTLITIERKAYGLDESGERGPGQGQNILIIEDCDAHLREPLPREEGFLSDEP